MADPHSVTGQKAARGLSTNRLEDALREYGAPPYLSLPKVRQAQAEQIRGAVAICLRPKPKHTAIVSTEIKGVSISRSNLSGFDFSEDIQNPRL